MTYEDEFSNVLNYYGDDLGVTYTPEKSTFRVWAPTAEKVELCIYKDGSGNSLINKFTMTKDKCDTWVFEIRQDLDGIYYTYIVTVNGVAQETQDPYSKACGVNGKRSMVVDLFSTNPDGFYDEKGPKLNSPVDAVICEVSIADITSSKTCGVKHKGKFLGLTEKGTKTPEGAPTGLDYLTSLGITHVQIMPSYDFGSIDESDTSKEQYNWGYDPVNYNVPEGSYATDPFHGDVRIKEMKQMIMALHQEGLGVIMDVVYNHTYDIEGSCFQKTVPDYFYRKGINGYSNASACGNELASEREMVSKYIIDSLVYWVTEYHIDGFRFDLMAVLDSDTIKKACAILKRIKPDIILYGEGWAGGDSVLPASKRVFKSHIAQIPDMGAFSDDIRDTIRGHVFYEKEKGYINGKKNMANDVRFSVVGATMHPQVDYKAYTYTTTGPWASQPSDTVNYISCHDNLTLWDKLSVSCPDASEEDKLQMNRLGAAIVFTSQGIPFFLSGEEFARTKPVEGSDMPCENSYNMPHYTNDISYERAELYKDLVAYYKGLIAFRKKHPLLRLKTAEEVRKKLQFIALDQTEVVAYLLEDEAESIFVAFNPTDAYVDIDISQTGTYNVYINHDQAGNEILDCIAGKAHVHPKAALVAVKQK